MVLGGWVVVLNLGIESKPCLNAPMPELHLSLVLAMSRMGTIMGLLLVTSVLLYLAINGMRVGKVGTRRSGYTEKESFVRFWITLCAYFFLAVMMFVELLVAVFAP